MPAMWTRRVLRSMMNKARCWTMPRSVTTSTEKKSAAAMAPGAP
jgi:hypothetical protein